MKISELIIGETYHLKMGIERQARYAGPKVDAYGRLYTFQNGAEELVLTMREVRLLVTHQVDAPVLYVSTRAVASRRMWRTSHSIRSARTPLEAVQQAFPDMSIKQDATHRFTIYSAAGPWLDAVVTSKPIAKGKPQRNRKAFNLWSKH